MTKWIALFAFVLLPAGLVFGQAVNGELTANGGQRVRLTNVAAYEVDSTSERGYMDVVVVLSDRALTREEVLTTGKLEELVKKNGLTALRVVLDPNCKVKSFSSGVHELHIVGRIRHLETGHIRRETNRRPALHRR